MKAVNAAAASSRCLDGKLRGNTVRSERDDVVPSGFSGGRGRHNHLYTKINIITIFVKISNVADINNCLSQLSNKAFTAPQHTDRIMIHINIV